MPCFHQIRQAALARRLDIEARDVLEDVAQQVARVLFAGHPGFHRVPGLQGNAVVVATDGIFRRFSAGLGVS